jgi:phage terminase small subunit
MARPRKPAKVKELNGTLRIDREPIPDPVQLPAIQMPTPPAMLAQDMTDGALAVWAMVEPGLSAAGLVSEANLFQLVRYCRLMDQWRDMQNKIQRIGSNVEGVSAFMNARLVEMMRMGKLLHEQIMEIDRVFGITPLYGDAINSRVKEEKSDLDKLMEG